LIEGPLIERLSDAIAVGSYEGGWGGIVASCLESRRQEEEEEVEERSLGWEVPNVFPLLRPGGVGVRLQKCAKLTMKEKLT